MAHFERRFFPIKGERQFIAATAFTFLELLTGLTFWREHKAWNYASIQRQDAPAFDSRGRGKQGHRRTFGCEASVPLDFRTAGGQTARGHFQVIPNNRPRCSNPFRLRFTTEELCSMPRLITSSFLNLSFFL